MFHVLIQDVIGVKSKEQITFEVPFTVFSPPYKTKTFELTSIEAVIKAEQTQIACWGLKMVFHFTMITRNSRSTDMKTFVQRSEKSRKSLF